MVTGILQQIPSDEVGQDVHRRTVISDDTNGARLQTHEGMKLGGESLESNRNVPGSRVHAFPRRRQRESVRRTAAEGDAKGRFEALESKGSCGR